MFWFLLIIVLFIIVFLKIWKQYQFWNKYEVPHLTPWPLLGHMAKFFFGLKSLHEIVRYQYNKFPQERYFGVYQFLQPTLVLKDINLIKQIAIRDFDSFIDHREFIAEEDDPLFAKSLFSLTGKKWRTMRSTLSPAFSGSKMRAMFVLMTDCANQFTDHLMKELNNDQIKTVETKDLFSRYTNDIIANCAFGVQCDSLKDKNNEFYTKSKEMSVFSAVKTLTFFGYTISPTLMRFLSIKLFNQEVSSFFKHAVMSTMKFREKNHIFRPDMIHLLMEAQKGKLKHDDVFTSKDSGYATLDESTLDKQIHNAKLDWDDEDITAQAVLFILAGFDTSSTMLCHLANGLAMYQDVQKRLQEEIDTAYEECDGNITYDILVKMKYLDMVLSETLRKWPVTPFVDRNCVKPYTLQSDDPEDKPLHIEKGVNIWIPVSAIQADPKYFPEPEKFDPERFSDENKKKILPFTFLPFGIGPRGCIGSRFAILEAKVLCFFLLRKFDILVVKETAIPFKHEPHQFTLKAANGFWVGLKLRAT